MSLAARGASRFEFYSWYFFRLSGLLLVLALLHGFNGLRVVVNEHVRWSGIRGVLQIGVAGATVLFLVLGTFVLIAFHAV